MGAGRRQALRWPERAAGRGSAAGRRAGSSGGLGALERGRLLRGKPGSRRRGRPLPTVTAGGPRGCPGAAEEQSSAGLAVVFPVSALLPVRFGLSLRGLKGRCRLLLFGGVVAQPRGPRGAKGRAARSPEKSCVRLAAPAQTVETASKHQGL